MNCWSSPFLIDDETSKLLKSYNFTYKEFGEINKSMNVLLVYDSPDNIFYNLLNNNKSSNLTFKFLNNYNEIVKNINNNYKSIAAWHLKGLSKTKFENYIIKNIKNKAYTVDKKSKPIPISPFISILTLGFLNSYPDFLRSYLELELSTNLFGREMDNNIIERLNINIKQNPSDIFLEELNILNSFKNSSILLRDANKKLVEEKEKDIEGLEIKIDNLKNLVENKQREIEDFEKIVKELKTLLSSKDENIKFIEEDLNRYKNLEIDNENILKERDKNLKGLEKSLFERDQYIKTIKSKNIKYIALVDQHQNKISLLESKIKELKSSILNIQNSSKKLDQIINDNKNLLEEKIITIKNNDKTIKYLKDLISEKESNNKLKEERNKKLRYSMENKLNNEIYELKNNLLRANDELKIDKMQLSYLQKEIENNLSIIKNNDQIIEEYNNQLDRSKFLLDNLFFEYSGQHISKIEEVTKISQLDFPIIRNKIFSLNILKLLKKSYKLLSKR